MKNENRPEYSQSNLTQNAPHVLLSIQYLNYGYAPCSELYAIFGKEGVKIYNAVVGVKAAQVHPVRNDGTLNPALYERHQNSDTQPILDLTSNKRGFLTG
jgi:hypothetical protein